LTYSAGGPSAVQLALRHPDRVSALVLVSTAIADKPLSLPPRPVLRAMAGSDFLFWLLVHPLRGLTQRMFIPSSYELTPAEDAQVAETVAALLPIEPRREGLLFDMYVTNTDPHRRSEQYDLEALTVPVLAVNAKDDPAANYQDAVAMVQRIPDARMLTLEQGGHMMLGSGDRVREAINRFLMEQTPVAQVWAE
jgi:pimeloyl-ACP methyl ester carboxylesterase